MIVTGQLRLPTHHVHPRGRGRQGIEVIEYAAQDGVLAVARDAVPGLLAPFLEPDQV